MKSILLITTAAFFAAASSSMAVVSINFSGSPASGPQFFISSNSSTVVPDGSLMRFGTFNTPPPANGNFVEFATSPTNPFHEFGRTTMGRDNLAAGNGRPVRNGITGGDVPNSPDPDSFFVGKTIYVWVYDATTADPLANQGIFATTLAFVDDAAPLSTSTTGYVNAFGVHAAPLTGDQASVVLANGLVTRFNLAQPIPEPATILSLAFAVVFGLVRRRR